MRSTWLLEDIPEEDSFSWSDFQDGEEEKSLSLVTEKVPNLGEDVHVFSISFL